MWQRWEDNKPVETRVREPGKRLPDREELGYDDQSEWEEMPSGEPKDPWQNTRLVYLVDPQTAEAFTFSTSSWGSRGAVNELGDQITRMRTVHADAVPIVELRAAEMPTKYGRKSKPVFKIVGWRTADGNQPAPVERQISAQAAKKEVAERQFWLPLRLRHRRRATRRQCRRKNRLRAADRDISQRPQRHRG